MEICNHCRKEVIYENDGTDQVCPECGWAKSAIKSSGARGVKDFDGKPNKILARAAAFLLILIGALSLVSSTILGITDIALGIGLVSLRERYRGYVVVLQYFQIIVGSVAWIAIVFLSASVAGLPLIESFVEYVVVVPFVIVIHIAILIMVTRKSVKAAFKAADYKSRFLGDPNYKK